MWLRLRPTRFVAGSAPGGPPLPLRFRNALPAGLRAWSGRHATVVRTPAAATAPLPFAGMASAGLRTTASFLQFAPQLILAVSLLERLDIELFAMGRCVRPGFETRLVLCQAVGSPAVGPTFLVGHL